MAKKGPSLGGNSGLVKDEVGLSNAVAVARPPGRARFVPIERSDLQGETHDGSHDRAAEKLAEGQEGVE